MRKMNQTKKDQGKKNQTNTRAAGLKGKASLIFLAGAVALGGAAILTTAYLTDQEKVVNEFTVGKVDIDLTEPEWNPEEHTKIQPTEEIKKDPQITNVGQNDAYVYLEIEVPMKEVIAADEDGTRQDKKKQELFTFDADAKWSLMKSEETDNSMVYTYCYTEVLAPQSTTNAIFETVTFVNVIEGQLDSTDLEIPVKAFAIQVEGTGGNGSTIVEKAENAFVKFQNQNKN